ncbi:exosome complex exonuclease Rrp41 [archaeon]|nr:exosome complex exonuclease Rrp41 [archaeon]
MAYTKRFDGRKFDEVREMEAKVGIIKRANGSAMFRTGKTIAIAAVYGPRELFPAFLQDPKKGKLKCLYDLLSFSVTERKRPGPSRRSTEISMVTRDCLEPVLDLTKFAYTGLDVYIYITQADAGTRAAGINAASLALADAGIPMKDLISSIAVGKVSDKIVVDLDKEEEDHKDGATDLPIAMSVRTGKLTLLQMDGNMNQTEIKKALEMGKKACEQIKEVQVKALQAKYGGAGK